MSRFATLVAGGALLLLAVFAGCSSSKPKTPFPQLKEKASASATLPAAQAAGAPSGVPSAAASSTAPASARSTATRPPPPPAVVRPPRTATATRTAAPPTVARRTPSAPTQAAGCGDPAKAAAQIMQSLTPQQQVGQLFMVGLSSDDDPGDAATLATISQYDAGNVVLYGTGWSGQAKVAVAATRLQAAAQTANGGIAAFIGGNQEGGQHGTFQAFYGPGFADIPSALRQGQMDPAALRANAAAWGQDLLNAGLNIDLAPVMDTVDQATAAQNGPIGQYDREFGYTPAAVSAHGVAFLQGMRGDGVPVAIKHFPGLGRVTGNTDFTAAGITDPKLTGPDDPNLQPFSDGIRADADFVMVSSAIYPNYPGVNAGEPALLSSAIMTGLLRGTLGFGGVIISDDVGAAASVANIAPADRALRFFGAGGDMLLTVNPADIGPMTRAVLARMGSDPAFNQQVQAAVQAVLFEKAQYGLLSSTPTCGAGQSAPQQRTGG